MALSRSRERLSTVDQEMEMNRSYLNLFKIRMGDRLRFRMDIPDKVKGLPFPPMLVQPLVENALRHGLESKIEGGDILIRADIEGDILRIEVADTGLGFPEKSLAGIGLSNLRERLQTLYGPKGRLVLRENHPSGLRAIIEVPCVTP
jgi:sensor histidine kinase YesM